MKTKEKIEMGVMGSMALTFPIWGPLAAAWDIINEEVIHRKGRRTRENEYQERQLRKKKTLVRRNKLFYEWAQNTESALSKKFVDNPNLLEDYEIDIFGKIRYDGWSQSSRKIEMYNVEKKKNGSYNLIERKYIDPLDSEPHLEYTKIYENGGFGDHLEDISKKMAKLTLTPIINSFQNGEEYHRKKFMNELEDKLGSI